MRIKIEVNNCFRHMNPCPACAFGLKEPPVFCPPRGPLSMAAAELATPRQPFFLPSRAAAGYPARKDRSHLLFSAELPVGMNDSLPSLTQRRPLINPPRFRGRVLKKDSRLSVTPAEKSGSPERHIREAFALSAISQQRENIMIRLPEDVFLSSEPQALRPPSRAPGSTCGLVPESMPPSLNAAQETLSVPHPAREPVGRSPARCGEKGCVFPAEGNESGLCSYHLRQQLEPALFSSWQPTWLLVNRPAPEFDCSESARGRSRDRRRLAAQCKAFRQGLA
jgi:hypothetical protein